VDWIHLDQDIDQWKALVNKEWIFASHKRQGISWQADWLLGSQEGLCSNFQIPFICRTLFALKTKGKCITFSTLHWSYSGLELIIKRNYQIIREISSPTPWIPRK
jgi:hypothetical protein